MDKMFVISIIAIIVPSIISIISLYKSICSNNKSERIEKLNSDLNSGQVELQIREMIFSAQKNYIDILKQLYPDKSDIYNKQIENAALEMWLNAYDEACAKYLDNKLDKERFKKTYYNEIRNLFENEDTKKYYDTISSKFQATKKVYKEWCNLEK